MEDLLNNIIFPLITSFVITYFSIPKIIHFSRKSRLYASVGDRDSHEGKIPIFGGVAIFSGILFSLLFWSDLTEVQFILISLLIVFFIGILDDLLSLTPLKKLIGQIISILVIIFLCDLKIDSFKGLFNIYDIHIFLAIIFTIFVVIVVTNAYNLIDGIDGLAGGLGMLASIFFSIFFFMNNDIQMVILSCSIIGALLSFLKFNFNPAKIFMGDTGSLVVGLILSVLAIKLINEGIEIPNDKTYKNKGPFIVIAILSVPLYDTFRVFCLRLLSGYHPLRPDRNHIHHALLDLGCSHKKATIILYVFSVVNIIISYFMIKLSLGLSIFLLSIFVLGLMAVPFVLLELKKNKSV